MMLVMLRIRPRAVTNSSKQAKMADHSSITTSPTQDHTIPISPFLCSPSFLMRNFINNGESEPILSPTSVLDTKPFFALGKKQFHHHPIWYDNIVVPKSPKIFSGNKQKQQPYWKELDSKSGVAVALINSPNDQEQIAQDKMVMFGSHLKVQIPPPLPLPPPPPPPHSAAVSPAKTPKPPPADFGIKIRNSGQMGSISKTGFGNSSTQTKDSPRVFAGCLMEVSEDYNCRFLDKSRKSASESFLSFCYTCKRKLGQEKDIYIYKGEKAFCSRACRCHEMLLDGMDNSE